MPKWDRRTIAISLSYLLLYVALDWGSYVQPVLKLGITPWSPQAGLSLAYLLVFGPELLPITALAAWLAEIIVRGASPVSPEVIGVSLWIALGYGSLSLWLRRWRLAEPPDTPSSAARLVVASLLITLVVAVGYPLAFAASGALPRSEATDSIWRYWLGDMNGILTLTPLLLYLRRWHEAVRAVLERPWEAFAQVFVLLVTLWVLFGLATVDQLRVFYPLFVPTIWIALRWGLPGAMFGPLIIQIGLVILAQDDTRAPPLPDLQFLMLTLSLTALLLGAVVTERETVLRRVAGQEAEQRALLAMQPDAVFAVDPSGLVRMANPAAHRLFGAAAGRGTRLAGLLPGLTLDTPEGRAALEGQRVSGGTFPAEIAWARLYSPATEGFLVTVRDATERRLAEAQLRERDTALARAMQFATAGEMASALAHELNQPITAVVSYLRASEILAAPLGDKDGRITSTLGKAAYEAMRAAHVLSRLRDFYRGDTMKNEPFDIALVCAAVAAGFQERLRAAGTTLALRIEDSLPQVEGDSTQIEIVLHNLISNAIDAVADMNERWRRIELSAYVEKEDLVVCVSDSGPGVSGHVLQKLFIPFTTSKLDGMGLGLSISRKLIRAQGGDLTYEPGERLGGARFVVRLPLPLTQDIP